MDLVRCDIVAMHFMNINLFNKKKLEKKYYIGKNFKAIELETSRSNERKHRQKCKEAI